MTSAPNRDRWESFDLSELNEIGTALCALRGRPSPMIKEIAAEFLRREEWDKALHDGRLLAMNERAW